MSRRDRTFTEESHPSTSYMVLEDEEDDVMNFAPLDDEMLQDSIPYGQIMMPTPVRLEDSDDDLTPFLMSTQPTRLNGLNMLNVATYVLNLCVSYGVGVWGLGGMLNTRVQIYQEHETLVTPATWAYCIWIPILVTETIFVTAQLFAEYRSRPTIQQGTSFFFFYTCLLQTGWTLFFSFRLFILSFICVVLCVISLAFLLTSQHLAQAGGRKLSHEEFWLFRFPFCLHFGWMVVMAVVQFAMLIRHDSSHHIGSQLASDIVALGFLLPVACFFLLQRDGHNFIIPGVILWSYVGMATRLQSPSETLLNDYGGMVVSAILQSLYIFISIVSGLLGTRMVIWTCNEFFTIRVINFGEEEDGGTFSRASVFNGRIGSM